MWLKVATIFITDNYIHNVWYFAYLLRQIISSKGNLPAIPMREHWRALPLLNFPSIIRTHLWLVLANLVFALTEHHHLSVSIHATVKIFIAYAKCFSSCYYARMKCEQYQFTHLIQLQPKSMPLHVVVIENGKKNDAKIFIQTVFGLHKLLFCFFSDFCSLTESVHR